MRKAVIPTVIEEMLEMPESQQRQILEYVQALRAASRRGVPGSKLLEFAGSISAEELQRMTQAIESECEQVDRDEW